MLLRQLQGQRTFLSAYTMKKRNYRILCSLIAVHLREPFPVSVLTRDLQQTLEILDHAYGFQVPSVLIYSQ